MRMSPSNVSEDRRQFLHTGSLVHVVIGGSLSQLQKMFLPKEEIIQCTTQQHMLLLLLWEVIVPPLGAFSTQVHVEGKCVQLFQIHLASD